MTTQDNCTYRRRRLAQFGESAVSPATGGARLLLSSRVRKLRVPHFHAATMDHAVVAALDCQFPRCQAAHPKAGVLLMKSASLGPELDFSNPRCAVAMTQLGVAQPTIRLVFCRHLLFLSHVFLQLLSGHGENGTAVEKENAYVAATVETISSTMHLTNRHAGASGA